MAGQITPLSGVTVLSLGPTLPGRYCHALLVDMGASVVVIEPPATSGVKRGAPQEGRSITPRSILAHGAQPCPLNLKSPAGHAAFLRLVMGADAVMESFRPGVTKRLNVHFEALSEANPRLIYLSLSGYGQTGPYADRVGHDINYLAAAGLIDLTGQEGGPPVAPGITYADGLAGIAAALNLLAALRVCDQTGRGCYLDLASVDGPFFVNCLEIERSWNTGKGRTRGDTHISGRWPWYNVMETRDRKWLSIGAVEGKFYATLCQALDLPDLAADQFPEGEARQRAFQRFRARFKERTLHEWMERFKGLDVAVMPAHTVEEAAADPHLRQRNVAHVGDPTRRRVRTVVRLSPEAPPAPASPLPPDEFLVSRGFTRAEVDALRREGALG